MTPLDNESKDVTIRQCVRRVTLSSFSSVTSPFPPRSPNQSSHYPVSPRPSSSYPISPFPYPTKETQNRPRISVVRSNSNTYRDDKSSNRNGANWSTHGQQQPKSPRSSLFRLRMSIDSTTNNNFCLKPERAIVRERKGVSLGQFASRPTTTTAGGPKPSSAPANTFDSSGTSFKQERTQVKERKGVSLNELVARSTATTAWEPKH